MPPKIKVNKEDILNVALRIVREKGIEFLNARELAKELGCSVHPIFRAFESMEKLKTSIYQMAEQLYNNQMEKSLTQPKDGFLSMGLTYIGFAREEKNLFRLLFMSDAFREQSMMDIVGATEGDEEVLRMICNMTGLQPASAKELYAGIWLTTHGIAAMFATNNCSFSNEEIKRLLSNSFQGLIMKLKQEEKQI